MEVLGFTSFNPTYKFVQIERDGVRRAALSGRHGGRPLQEPQQS